MLKMMFDNSQILVRKLIVFVSTHIDRDIILIKAIIDHERFSSFRLLLLKVLDIFKKQYFLEFFYDDKL